MQTKLKQVRLNKGLTQAKLAELANLNVRVLEHYEQGSKKFDHARLDKILNVCIALDCKIQDVIENKHYIELLNKYEK